MPAIDLDVTNVPDIIEAQLTLSYSRLTDLICAIVDQGNGHDDDIDDIRNVLKKLVQENNSLRNEIDSLKKSKDPNEEAIATIEALKSTVADLSKKVAENAEAIAAGDKARQELTENLEKQMSEQQAAIDNAFEEYVGQVGQRLSTTEMSLRALQAFNDLWGASPEQVLEMGRRTNGQLMEHSIENRTRYVLSLPAFQRMQEEMDVLRALLQRQAADALSAKTTEAARSSRKSSVATVVGPSEPATDFSADIKHLSNTMHLLELDVQALQKERLRPLESAVRELQTRTNPEKRVRGADDNVDRLLRQVGQLEGRLNKVLSQAVEAAPGDTGAASVGLADVAHRVSVVEDILEGFLHKKRPELTSGDLVAGGETADADRVPAEASVRPLTSNPGNRPAAEPSPLSGAGSNGVLPALTKGAPGSSSSPIPAAGGRSTSGSSHHASTISSALNTPEVSQPTVHELRLLEASQPRDTSNTRRISVALEPGDGLCRRVAQLEENTAILEVNKADRQELRVLEETLRHALNDLHLQQSLPPRPPFSNAANGGPPLLPQRPVSAGGRVVSSEYAASHRRSDMLGRPHTSSAALGRPMFVGSTSVYLRDGVRLTNATVSASPQHQDG